MRATLSKEALLALSFASLVAAGGLAKKDHYGDDCIPNAPLAVITPCPTCDLITVTKQGQPVSTYLPQYAVKQANGDYETIYKKKQYNWISTVIPQAVPPYYATVTDSGQYVTVGSRPKYGVQTIEIPTPGVYDIGGKPTFVPQPGAVHYYSRSGDDYDSMPFDSMPEYYQLLGKKMPSSWDQPRRSCHCPVGYTSPDECDCSDTTDYIDTHEEEAEYEIPGYPVVVDQEFDTNGIHDFNIGGVNIEININNAPTHYIGTHTVPPSSGTTVTTVTNTRTVSGDSTSTPAPTTVGGITAPFVIVVGGAGPAGKLRHKHKRGQHVHKRAASGYLKASGANFVLTDDSSEAARFQLNLKTGQLLSGGSYISAAQAEVDAGNGKVTVSNTSGRLSTRFTISGDKSIHWNNAAFQDGFANFCHNPVDNTIYELFGGIQPSTFTCNIIQLVTADLPAPTSSSDGPTATGTNTNTNTSTTPTNTGGTIIGTGTTANPTTQLSTTQPPTGGPSATAPAGFQASALAKHNAVRAIHQAPAMTWNEAAAIKAQAVADTCVFAHSGGPFGENLAAGYSNVDQAIQAWFDERAQYNFNNPGFSDATGHFTQVVWVASTGLGCAVKFCPNLLGGSNFYVCEYSPAGNVGGQYQQNVLPAA